MHRHKEMQGKEDVLTTVVETRLGRISQEQEALRNAVFHRLAEREAALRKFTAAQTTSSSSSSSSSSPSGLETVESKSSFKSENQEEDASDIDFNEERSISQLGNDSHVVSLAAPASPPGPWKASMRPNVQLERVKSIRSAKEEKQRRLHPKRLQHQKMEARRRDATATALMQQRSEHLRAAILKGKEDKVKREEEKRQEIFRAQEKVALLTKSAEEKREKYQNQVQKLTSAKVERRKQRQQQARARRTKAICQEQRRQRELYLRLEQSSRTVKQRMVERQATVADHRQKDTEHRKRVAEYLQMTKCNQEQSLLVREEQRQRVLLQQEEKRRKAILHFVQMKIDRRADAERRKREQDELYRQRKLKLRAQTDQRMFDIEEEQERKRFVEEQLQEQLKVPNATFRTFASTLLNGVSEMTSVDELRKAASQLEQQFKETAEQQRVESWELYSTAKNTDIWSPRTSRSPSRSPSRPATSSSRRRLRRRRPQTSNSGRPKTRGSGSDSNRLQSHCSPSRPSSSLSKRRPRTVSTPGRRHRRNMKYTVSAHLGVTRNKICALCRGAFGSLPHRVLRKAVLELKATLGVPRPNIQRWKTAVYYDQVSVCAMCRQFTASQFDGSSRYNSTASGPIRKTAEEVERENELQLREQREANHREKEKKTASKQEKAAMKAKQLEDEVVITVRLR
jgi:hypothetical protein